MARARRYFPHIYFESKAPGRDSVFMAVKDVGRPGVHSATEVKMLAAAQLADVYDGYTRDHHGRRIRFTTRLFVGRLMVLRRLAARFGGKRAVAICAKYGLEALKARSERKRKLIVKEGLKKLGLTKRQITALLRKVNR